MFGDWYVTGKNFVCQNRSRKIRLLLTSTKWYSVFQYQAFYSSLDCSFCSVPCKGFPGSYPFTRGVYSTMYHGKLWTMRQFAGFATPEDTNRRFKFLLGQGQTGLSTAFDMPTLMGYDCDHPRAMGEVGKEGVSVSSLEDMEVLFGG